VIERIGLAPGYTISRIIHGGWQFSAGHRLGGTALDDAVEVLVASADRGVTTFDCADIYTGVEELYGRFLRTWKSTSGSTPIQIHTKFVPDYEDLPRVDKAYVERIIDRSLRRLGLETLDLVQYYWWRDDVPGMEQTAVWLSELQAAGKIRHLAATNLGAHRLRRIADAGVELVANQVQYSALDRRPENGLVDYCAETGMGLLCFGTLAGGFLTDRWHGAPDLVDRDNRSLVKYRLIIDEFGGWEAYQRLLRAMHTVAQAHQTEISAVALRIVLDRPAVSATIVGATKVGQMERNLRALSVDMTPLEKEHLRTLMDAAPGPRGDVFELERDRDGPHGRIMKYDLNKGPGT